MLSALLALEGKGPTKIKNALNATGHRTKGRTITSRDGQTKEIGANRFTSDTVRSILQNPIYKGCIRYDDQLYDGEHQATVDPARPGTHG